MKNLLMTCYYDGMELNQAIDFIVRNYEQRPTTKQIEKAQQEVKACTGKEWK